MNRNWRTWIRGTGELFPRQVSRHRRISAWWCVPQTASGVAGLGNVSLRVVPEETARERRGHFDRGV